MKKESIKDKHYLTIRWKKQEDGFNKYYVYLKGRDTNINVLLYADDNNLYDGFYEIKYYSNSNKMYSLDVTVTPITSLGSALASKRSFNFSKRKKSLKLLNLFF